MARTAKPKANAPARRKAPVRLTGGAGIRAQPEHAGFNKGFNIMARITISKGASVELRRTEASGGGSWRFRWIFARR
jgi:hypothetical protein